MKLRILFTFFTLLFTCQIIAQQSDGELSGIVLDKKNQQALEFVTVKLFKTSDSTMLTGTVTDSLGHFKFEKLAYGSYILVTDFIGYEAKNTNPIQLTAEQIKITNIRIFITDEPSKELKEVEIIGKKEAYEISLDKKVYNVGEDISTRGGSANDVLTKIPSVDVDQDGNVSLRGDGNVRILIDGRPSSMTSGGGKSLLDGIPANTIERIEIINNPSAKYDPDGTSGIINIVLKKNKTKGFNMMLSTTGATGDFIKDPLFNGKSPLVNSSLSLNVRNSKMNAFASYSYKYNEGYRNNWGTLYQLKGDTVYSQLKQDRIGNDSTMSHVVKIGADFYLQNDNTLGFSTTGNHTDRARSGDLHNEFYSGETNLTDVWSRSSQDPNNQDNFDLNLNHKKEWKAKKMTLESFATQSFGNTLDQGVYEEKYYTISSSDYFNEANINSSRAFKNQHLESREKNDVLTLQTDFTKIIDKNKSRFEAGAKAIIRNQTVNSNSQTMDTISNQYVTDTLSNFQYAYKEQIYSLYGIYGQQKGKWKYQAGVRLEQAFQIPNLITTGEKYTNNYFNFFPSGHIKYNHKEGREISLSYSRRINRATSDNLNPFTSYADPFNLRKGNPALKPEYINSFDLGYSIETKKFNVTSSLFYRYTTGVIQRVKLFNSNSTATVTFANIDQSHSGGIEIVFNYRPYTWWRNTLSFNGAFIRYIDDTKSFNYNNSGFNLSGKFVSSVEYWNKTMTSQLNIQYNAPQTTAQGIIQRRGAIEFSTEKSLYHNKWSVGFRISDILNRQGFWLKVDQPSIHQTSNFKWLTRRFYLTVTYKFGKVEMGKNKTAQPENAGGGGMDF